jgi:hypothetical protein
MHSLPLELVDETALVSGYVNGWLVACEGEGYGGLVAVGGSSARARRRPFAAPCSVATAGYDREHMIQGEVLWIRWDALE